MSNGFINNRLEHFGIKMTDFNVDDVEKGLKADLYYRDNTYYVVMYNADRLIYKEFEREGYEPRCGVDVADHEKANEVIEEVIKMWSKR